MYVYISRQISLTGTLNLLLLLALLATTKTTRVLADSKSSPADALPCISKDFGRGSIVCVCNSTYCDRAEPEDLVELSPLIPPDNNDIQVYTSSKSGQRMVKTRIRFNNKLEDLDQRSHVPLFPMVRNLAETFNFVLNLPTRHRLVKLVVRRDQKYQNIIGIGGAFTDAAGINIATLSNATQANLLRSYFAPEGNRYNLGRVPIGGTDFSTRPYTYDDRGKEPDVNLTHFALQPEDYKYKIPYILEALKLSNNTLQLVASPWSAPVWMKSNNKLNGAGVLRKEYYQTWADYIIKFLDSYRNLGIPVWGVTTGNEPFNGFVLGFPFNCMGWKSGDMRNWIENHLGPSLKEKRQDLNTRIIIFDDNKGALPTWAKDILGVNSSAKYVDGMGTHWYFDFLTGADVLTRVHRQYPQHFIIQTEACLGFTPWERDKVIPGSWERAERYLSAIITDLQNWVSGWLDWNLAVDMNGGPNWAKFAADAGVLVEASGRDEFYKQPIYYAIGHVSKFVPRDSVRIGLDGSSRSGNSRNLESIAFHRPADNSTVIVLLNKMVFDATVSIYDHTRGNVFVRVPARSMQTLIYH